MIVWLFVSVQGEVGLFQKMGLLYFKGDDSNKSHFFPSPISINP